MSSVVYKKLREDVPRLVLRDTASTVGERVVTELAKTNIVGALLALIADSGNSSRAWSRSLCRSLIEEGRGYAQSPSGQRWAALLEASPAVNNGWLLWNHANLDFYLNNAEPLAEHPGALLEAMLAQLATADIADLLTQLSRLSADIDAGLRASSDAESTP